MDRQEQREWLHRRLERDPYAAHQEFEIRRLAHEAYERLYSGDPSVELVVSSPGSGKYGMRFEEVTIHQGDLYMIGALEGLLVLEEVIRRAKGLSTEGELELKLAGIKAAL